MPPHAASSAGARSTAVSRVCAMRLTSLSGQAEYTHPPRPMSTRRMGILRLPAQGSETHGAYPRDRSRSGAGRAGGVGWHAARARFSASRHGRGAHGRARLGVAIVRGLSLIHISEPTRLGMISYAVFCLKKKKKKQ